VCAALAAWGPEGRRGGVRHSLAALVRQRMVQLACGYGDQHEAGTLRAAPGFTVACGRRPASAPDLASQPTLARLDAWGEANAVGSTSGLRPLALARTRLTHPHLGPVNTPG
jgi:hypothetical protein